MLVLLLAAACGPGSDTAPVPDPAPPAPAAPAPLPPPSEARYAASHVLVTWAGAEGAPTEVTRSESEARDLAVQVRERAVAGEAFDDLARAHSDGPSAARGGSLGTYRTGTMIPGFEAAVASVDEGHIAPLVRSPFGYHVARREAVRQIAARHVLVAFAGAWRSDATRSEAAAEARAGEALAALEAGETFEEVAATFGEDATAAHGGDLGRISPGQLIPEFEDAVFALQIGERAGPVRTAYGFHIVERTE